MIGKRRGGGIAAALMGGIAAGILAGTPLTAHAQYVDPALSHDYAVKIGAFLPIKKEVRQAGGTYNLSIEGDIVIQRFPERSFVAVASVGYIERDGFRTIPVTVSQLYRDPGSPSHYNYYYGYGLGLYPTRLRLSGTSNRAKTLFGGFVVAGIDFTSRYFGELKYHLVSKYDDKNISGFQASIGTRF